ncbi:DUF6644 family protein [Uliginosibacterium sp. H3]|uniref:DUF6644 family protein n=1 Tax=Uliginosibacterium silvisoli TaxID=3114758 RepID=A0ABU6K3W0_9RHOO|nr:DUF6644 family protein [Uliginosibacterium sp. H3]
MPQPIQSLQHFSDWLSTTPLSVGIQSAAWVVPSVQTLHILLIAALIASVALLNARLLGFAARSQPVADVARRFLPWVWWAVPGLALTGLILIIAEPARELTNPIFFAKLFLLLLVLLLTGVVQYRLNRNPAGWERQAPGDAAAIPTTFSAKLVGASSLLLWVGIVVAGRWIAYFLDL